MTLVYVGRCPECNAPLEADESLKENFVNNPEMLSNLCGHDGGESA